MMTSATSAKPKNPDAVYLLVSTTIMAKRPFSTFLDSSLKQKKIDYGASDKIFRFSMVCIVEPRAGPASPPPSDHPDCEESAILAYIDVDGWKEIGDIRAYCDVLERYVNGLKAEDKGGPRVHLVISSVRERISAKKIERWNMESYEDLVADLVINYHFDVAEVSSEADAAQYVAEIAEAYSELRERKKADKQKKILPVASKGIKGSKRDENKLLVSWMAGLACIPGISENKARAIAKDYPTMRSVMDKYLAEDTKEFGKKEKESLLNGIKYTLDDKGNKIGKKLSKRVYRYFTSPDPNEILN